MPAGRRRKTSPGPAVMGIGSEIFSSPRRMAAPVALDRPIETAEERRLRDGEDIAGSTFARGREEEERAAEERGEERKGLGWPMSGFHYRRRVSGHHVGAACAVGQGMLAGACVFVHPKAGRRTAGGGWAGRTFLPTSWTGRMAENSRWRWLYDLGVVGAAPIQARWAKERREVEQGEGSQSQ